MPAPYSMDLRRRVVASYQAGGTVDGVAEQFGIGRSSVSRLLWRQRERGSLEPDPMGGSRGSLIGDKQMEQLGSLVEERADRTREEFVDAYEELTGIRVSVSTMGRALKRAGISRKKRPSAQRSGTAQTSCSPAKSLQNSSKSSSRRTLSASTRPARTRR